MSLKYDNSTTTGTPYYAHNISSSPYVTKYQTTCLCLLLLLFWGFWYILWSYNRYLRGRTNTKMPLCYSGELKLKEDIFGAYDASNLNVHRNVVTWYTALARANLAFWPPLNVTPFSPTSVRSPAGKIWKQIAKQLNSQEFCNHLNFWQNVCHMCSLNGQQIRMDKECNVFIKNVQRIHQNMVQYQCWI